MPIMSSPARFDTSSPSAMMSRDPRVWHVEIMSSPVRWVATSFPASGLRELKQNNTSTIIVLLSDKSNVDTQTRNLYRPN